MCVPAPTCREALREASRVWPGRRIDSDGICASAAHTAQNPNSDHETGDAFDLSHDPLHGLDTYALAERLRLRCRAGFEPRVAYIISHGRIAGPFHKRGYEWRPYTGPNPHDHHMHVSLDRNRAGVRDDTRPWWAWVSEPSKEPKVQPDHNPPWVFEPIVSDLACPTGGTWLLGLHGGVYATGGAPYYGGPAGKPYWLDRTDRVATGLRPFGAGGYTVLTDAASEHYDYAPR
jgi:hypothetical protein